MYIAAARQVITVLILLPLMICQPVSARELRVTIAEYSEDTEPYFEALAEAFEKDHPETDVHIEVVTWEVLLQKLSNDQLANNPPDLSVIATPWLLNFVEDGAAEPLDQYMNSTFREQFFDVFLTPSVLHGKTYGLPLAASARALFYNKALLEEAGISSPPDNWAQLGNAARSISELNERAMGFGIQGRSLEVDIYFYYAFWAFGGQLIKEDGTSGLNSKAGYGAAEFYRSLIQSGATQPGVTGYQREDLEELFMQGRLGMMIDSPILSKLIEEDESIDLDYGVAPIPAGADGTRSTYGVTDSIIMFEKSHSKETAWEFLELLFSKKWRERFNALEGFLPVHKDVAAMPYYINNKDLKSFTALLPEARFAPVIANWEEIAARTSDALQRIYLGDAEVRSSLDEAAARINTILKR